MQKVGDGVDAGAVLFVPPADVPEAGQRAIYLGQQYVVGRVEVLARLVVVG